MNVRGNGVIQMKSHVKDDSGVKITMLTKVIIFFQFDALKIFNSLAQGWGKVWPPH